MRKFLLIFTALFVMAVSVNAQEKGDMAAGVNFTIGTGNDITNFGLGAKFQWNIIDNLRLEPSFTYFFETDDIKMWDINLNLHYQFVLTESFSIYPLAGFTLLGAKAGDSSDSELGVNLGVGLDYNLSKRVALNVEAKYKVNSLINRFVPSVGIAYKF